MENKEGLSRVIKDEISPGLDLPGIIKEWVDMGLEEVDRARISGKRLTWEHKMMMVELGVIEEVGDGVFKLTERAERVAEIVAEADERCGHISGGDLKDTYNVVLELKAEPTRGKVGSSRPGMEREWD